MTGLIVQEWIETSGGAEQVLRALRQALPDSRMYALWNDDPGRFAREIVDESWMARTILRRHKAMALPFMHHTWANARVPERPDWVLASSYVFAHHSDFGTRTSGVPKYTYVHTPARYIWEPELDGRGAGNAAAMARLALRNVDRKAAAHAGDLAANSHFVRRRVIRAWERDARVIYPPVEATSIIAGGNWSEHLSPEEFDVWRALPHRGFLLAASRLVRYKRHAEVIRMGQEFDIPVVVVGTGPEEAHLRAIAAESRVPVHFLGYVSDEMIRALFQRALAFVFPPVEDFGIVPVEAMAAGATVLVNREGGAAESVQDGVTGFHVDPLDMLDVRTALDGVGTLDAQRVRARAAYFDTSRFLEEVRAWVEGVAPVREAGLQPAAVNVSG